MKKIRKKIIITLWLVIVLVLGSLIGLFYGVINGYIGDMPDLAELQNPVNRYSSKLFDCNGDTICDWSLASSNRTYSSYNELSPYLIKALVATEDVRFYDHSGIDYKALLRALLKRGVMNKKSAGGGSTITQQLAKQVYTNVDGQTAKSTKERLFQKPMEWIIAVQLERLYTKDEIIAMYFNQYDFLYNANGIKMAALTYFQKRPCDLTLSESAILVGMCKNAALFKPVLRAKDGTLSVNPSCVDRRNVVIDQMLKAGYISTTEGEMAKAEPIDIEHFSPTLEDKDQQKGRHPYLREYLRKIMMAKKPVRSEYSKANYGKYYNDSVAWEDNPLYGWCNKNCKRDGSHYNLYTDGLRVYSTIDTTMQNYAENAVRAHLASLQSTFDRQIGSPLRPYYSGLGAKKIAQLTDLAMQRTNRWMTMAAAGCDTATIRKSFRTPYRMKVYSPNAPHHERDTTMTPLDSMLYTKHYLRAAFMAMEPNTGFVKCYVGGEDFDYFQYDMVMTGRRQIGSTMKPLLYSQYMQNGYTPCDKVSSRPIRFDGGHGGAWIPKGGAFAGGGEIPVKTALQTSNNTCSAHIIHLVTPYDFIEWLHDLGIGYIDHDKYENDILCLGAPDISLYEMCGAYTAFVSKGVRHAPVLVTRITDSEGNVLADLGKGLQPYIKEVMSESTSYKMIDMMRAVIQRGTGRPMNSYHHGDMIGKTGTTNDNSDGWFMCCTPELVMGAWVGGEERFIHFATGIGQGAKAALPICGRFIRSTYSNEKLGYKSGKRFDIPQDFNFCDSHDPEDPDAKQQLLPLSQQRKPRPQSTGTKPVQRPQNVQRPVNQQQPDNQQPSDQSTTPSEGVTPEAPKVEEVPSAVDELLI